MKTLFAALMLASSFACAEEWMETPNEAGGKILFLSGSCGESKDVGRMVIATIPDGTVVNGCWYYFAEMIHVVWKNQGGRTSSFDPKNLSYRKTP